MAPAVADSKMTHDSHRSMRHTSTAEAVSRAKGPEEPPSLAANSSASLGPPSLELGNDLAQSGMQLGRSWKARGGSKRNPTVTVRARTRARHTHEMHGNGLRANSHCKLLEHRSLKVFHL